MEALLDNISCQKLIELNFVEINLESNEIIELLCELFDFECCYLDTLRLVDCKLTSNLIKKLLNGLNQTQQYLNIKHLNLSHNNFYEEGT